MKRKIAVIIIGTSAFFVGTYFARAQESFTPPKGGLEYSQGYISCRKELYECYAGTTSDWKDCLLRNNSDKVCNAKSREDADVCRATYCSTGKEVEKSKPSLAPEPEKRQEEAPPRREVRQETAPVVPDEVKSGLLRADCSVNDKTFDKDWEKYSNIDERVPLQSRSREAQQYGAARSKIVEKRLVVFLLRRDMEIDRQARLIMREYREALVKNVKTNLLKAFWRLAYITFDTVYGTPGLGEGAVGTGKSFVKIFSDEAVPIQKISSAIKVLRDFTPGDSRLAIDTQKWRGKVQAVGTTAALDTLDTLGDPTEVGKSVAQDIIKQTLPSADITPEEVEILRTQHLDKRALDDALQESYRINFERRDRAEELESEVKALEVESDGWKEKEKSRVASLLQKSCREKIKK